MKIALIENFGSDFYGARLRYAQFLKNKGHHVVAIVPNDGYADKIKEGGIETIALDIDIRKRSLGSMLSFAKQLRKIFKKEKFDVIHFYRMQPNIIGTPIAYFSSKKSKLLNHITGLGVAFTKSSFKFNTIQTIIKSAYKINNSWFDTTLIFQNIEDQNEVGISKPNTFVVKGSAVNEDRFNTNVISRKELLEEIEDKLDLENATNLIFVSRLLKQKGLSYLIDAIQNINKKGNKKINLLVAGWIDPNNPDSFSEQEINEYAKLKEVLFLGKRTDINEIINFCDIAVLPTFYREGTPRFLLESMAMGKTILTTDMPGCNHLIKDNGILVSPQSEEELRFGLEKLLVADLNQLGENSSKLYQSEFSENVVYNQLLNSYKS